MKPSEFKARLKQIERSEQRAKPVEQSKPFVLAPQCPAEEIRNGGLVALYCLENEGHEGPHRFEEGP